ncbi:MAG: hypothetical protein DRK00_09425 [Thermoprotei archaeon]|nr:MAG: hypothetical protein DRK00_09425 [Thermoprotei archaeon]
MVPVRAKVGIKQVNVKLKEEEWRKLAELARKENLSVYSYVKKIILEKISEPRSSDVEKIWDKLSEIEASIAIMNTRLSRLEKLLGKASPLDYITREAGEVMDYEG